jgi:hypothetical protein
MTNEKRNTAIMDKIERYTQHHTTTPDLAQGAIARISMNNGKDSEVPIMRIQSPETFKELFRINADGTVEGEIENASEAARLFVESLRGYLSKPTQTDALREALEGVLPYVLTDYFQCNGDKCRHPTCASCFGEDFAESQSDKANLALTKAKAAIAALQEQSK